MLTDDFNLDDGIIELQNKLNLPQDFFERLLKEDDWSFIIKLHALIEAACTDSLLHRINEPDLKSIISRLELSNKSTGKLAFIKELGLIGTTYRRYISSLSEWRNNFVHNVENCNASLTDIVSRMEKNALKKFALDFSPHETFIRELNHPPLELFDKQIINQADTNNLIKRAKDNPKFHIWFGGYTFLSSLKDVYDSNEYIHYDRAMNFTGQYEEDDRNDPDFSLENDIV